MTFSTIAIFPEIVVSNIGNRYGVADITAYRENFGGSCKFFEKGKISIIDWVLDIAQCILHGCLLLKKQLLSR